MNVEASYHVSGEHELGISVNWHSKPSLSAYAAHTRELSYSRWLTWVNLTTHLRGTEASSEPKHSG